MYSRRMMITGAIMVIAAFAILVFALVMIGEEEDMIGKAAGYDGSPTAAKQGDMIIVEGRVSGKNKILIHDFVDGAKEHNDAGTWLILEAYRQPIIADLGKGEIILISKNICSRGEKIHVVSTDDRTPNNDPIRFEGLRRGDPISAIGTLTSRAPASLDVAFWYSGTASEYKRYVASGRKNSYIFFAVLSILGAGLFLWGLRRAKAR